jgi:glycosyltransferase involved in cell wall biosynthesis
MCGLATFTASLRGAMAENRGSGRGLDVMELVDDPEAWSQERPEVVASIDPGDAWSLQTAARKMSGYDAIILQHEYGIWGPDMGRGVVDFVGSVESLLISTLHTLLPNPDILQEEIIEKLANRSIYTVVPTRAGRTLLTERYPVDPRSVVVIPHGVDAVHRSVARLRALKRGPDLEPRILTWGLIGPGKGLEWSLRAVGALKHRYPDIRYTIAGRTHPKVLSREGEEYRESLQTIISETGLAGNVEFIDDYLTPVTLRDLLLQANIIVLPYDSTEQIVSGVLVEAVAANVPVVATAFPHAVELAEMGAAATVPPQSPLAIADAIDRLLGSAEAWDEMVARQRLVAPELEWRNVARQYERLVEEAVLGSSPMSHASPAS